MFWRGGVQLRVSSIHVHPSIAGSRRETRVLKLSCNGTDDADIPPVVAGEKTTHQLQWPWSHVCPASDGGGGNMSNTEKMEETMFNNARVAELIHLSVQPGRGCNNHSATLSSLMSLLGSGLQAADRRASDTAL